MVDRSNPFALGGDMDKRAAVLAFELDWHELLGLDYRWALVEKGRLVVEMRLLTKRTFRCVSGPARQAAGRGVCVALFGREGGVLSPEGGR
jgi:hypothetical protein